MQNLRILRETELVEQSPAHFVAYWLNLSTRMAERHYLQVTEDYYRRATSREVSNGKQTFAPETSFVEAQVGANILLSQLVAVLIEHCLCGRRQIG